MVIALVCIYFALLLIVGHYAKGKGNNQSFFSGERRSSWWLVAFGMIGASISGVTFLSVPGMVLRTDMTYLQTCMGFILGYFIVAFVLLPIYYKLNLTTIYTYLEQRFGRSSHLTGAWFFFLSKLSATAVKFYVACYLVYTLLSDRLFSHYVAGDSSVLWSNLLFVAVALGMSLLVWLYSRHGGIRTLVFTDTLQTLCIFIALVLIISEVVTALNMPLGDVAAAVVNDSHSRIFVFDDWLSTQNFWKQFISGAFIVVVMTGLDQDMMQKNLTCRTLRDAQKDMCSYGFAFLPANALFLVLGVLLVMLANSQGLSLPSKGDELLTMFVTTGRLGEWSMALFLLGVIAASFSSADSALTSLTTSYCLDIRRRADDEHLRHRVHIVMTLLLVAAMTMFHLLNSTSVIDAIYIMVGYTYGPLLGMFAFGLLTKKTANDRYVPIVAIASPLICYAIDYVSTNSLDYKFGYELLMLNGIITCFGLYVISKKSKISTFR